MPQTLRFCATEGSEPAAEKGPARSAADLAHLASMIDPFSESGGVRLAKGAVTHLRFHDGTKVGSARLEKVLAYLATHLGVDEADVLGALTFGNHAPTASLAKTAFVLALELADAGVIPDSVPPALLGSTAGASGDDETRVAHEAELSKLRMARDTAQEHGFDIGAAVRQRIAELEATIASTNPAPTDDTETGSQGDAGDTPPWAAIVEKMGARLDALQDLLAGMIRSDDQQRQGDQVATITLDDDTVGVTRSWQPDRSQTKRKYDGAGELQREVLDLAGPERRVTMADFPLVAGWSAATRAKLAAGTFIEFTKLYRELQEGAKTRKKKVRVEDGQLVVDDGTATASVGAEFFQPLDHHAHAQVFNHWLRLMRRVHASNTAVLRDFDRLEARVLGYAQSYPGVGYQRYLRVVRQRMAHVAELGSSTGTHLRLGFGDPDPDLFLQVFGTSSRMAVGSGDAHGPSLTRNQSTVPTCLQYNQSRGCRRPTDSCRYEHICSECGGDHAAHECRDDGNRGHPRKRPRTETVPEEALSSSDTI